ncbi:MAG: YggT family protein [Pseudomonadota bacterium]
MGSLLTIFLTLIDVAMWVIIIHAIFSWLVAFQVLNLSQPLVRQIWSILNRLTEPVYRPIRRMIPDLGGIDITPIFLILLLYFISVIACNNLGPHPSCPLG